MLFVDAATNPIRIQRARVQPDMQIEEEILPHPACFSAPPKIPPEKASKTGAGTSIEIEFGATMRGIVAC
jgi:hypothetical protein